MEKIEVFKWLDKEYGRDNWKIRKVSRNKRGEPSFTISSVDLKKIGVNVDDKVLVVIDKDRIIIQKL